MSSSALVEKLGQLGFPGAGSLDPQSLDWLLENEALAPMLDWFCQNITTANLLDPPELKEFNTLSSSGEIILKGRQLEEALSHLTVGNEETMSEEAIQEDIQQLTSRLQHYDKKKKQLMRRRNLLSNHQNSQSHRLSKLGAMEQKTQHKYKKVLEQTHADNQQVNDSLTGLTKSVENLSQLYSQSAPSQHQSATESYLPSQGQTGSAAMFLSQVPVQQYYSMEEDYTAKLTAYTKKQFFELLQKNGKEREHFLFRRE